MFDEFDYFETPELDWNEFYGTPTVPDVTGEVGQMDFPTGGAGTPSVFNAAKDSQAANASENLPVNSDFTGGVNLVNGNPGVFDQLKNALGPDWMRTLLAGLTAAGAFRQPQTGAGALGAPRTRPGLSAFQMATSPGGLNFSVNGRGANVAFAGGGKVKGALSALRGMFRSSDDLTEGRALVPQQSQGALSRREFLKNTGASAARALPDATNISPVTAASIASKVADAVEPAKKMGPVVEKDDLLIPPTFRAFYSVANERGIKPTEDMSWREVYRKWQEDPEEWSDDFMDGGLYRREEFNSMGSDNIVKTMKRLNYVKQLKNGDLVVNPKYADRIMNWVHDIPSTGEAPYASGGPVGALGRCCSAMAEGGPFVGYVTGPGGGQDDLIEARLSPGEYVFDADSVAALGDGNNEEGARRLDAMRAQIRGHKREAPPTEIPPQAAPPEEYLSAAMQGGV